MRSYLYICSDRGWFQTVDGFYLFHWNTKRAPAAHSLRCERRALFLLRFPHENGLANGELNHDCATPAPAAEAVVAGPRFQCIRGAAANIRDNHTITNVYTDMSSI